MWRTAFDRLGNHKTSFLSQIFHHGELLSKPKVIAAAVHEFFVGKICDLKEQFPRQHTETDDQSLDVLKKDIAKREVPLEGLRANDNSPLTADTDPLVLQTKAQNEADNVTGCLKKSGICFMINISIKLNTILLGIYFI